MGSHVHAMVEQLILWQASPEGRGSDLALPVLPDHLQGQDYDGCPVEDVADWMIDGFLNFVSEWKPVFRAAEMTVFNYGLGIAGTLDIIADLPDVALAPSGSVRSRPPVRVCIDVKTGFGIPGVTWQEQVAAYRQMTECQPDRLATDLHPMPATDCGAVLHLRPEHLDGYRLMPVKPADHAEAWNCFRRAVEIYRSRSARRAKPGKVVYPPRPDGTIPPPRLADLDGEGYGRALVPLVKAGIGDLEQVAAMDAGECLKIKGVGGKLLGAIRVMLADHGLALKGEELLTLTLAVNGGRRTGGGVMAVLDIQRQGQQIGRIRIGQQVAVVKDGHDTGKTRPAKLDTFRFTTDDQFALSGRDRGALRRAIVRAWRGEW